MPASAREALFVLGVWPPFLNVGGQDDRKNIWGLIDGFAGLPARLRESHQLVVACQLHARLCRGHPRACRARGVGGSLLLLNRISDESLRLLYRHCTAFVFPSLYEGFGLPILEAMHCGAPVIVGRNSSQVEVVGEAGLTFDAYDPSELTQRLVEVLDQPSLGERLRQASVAQAGQFRWEQTAARALAALERVSGRSIDPAGRTPVRRSPRPKIAVMSPLPPLRSGISDYTARLIQYLAEYYAIDVYRDVNFVPFLELQNNDFGCYDHRLFERLAPARNYRAVLYQMGNSSFHRYIYDRLDRWPGLVTLHDFSLVGFQELVRHAARRGAGPLPSGLRGLRPTPARRSQAAVGGGRRRPSRVVLALHRADALPEPEDLRREPRGHRPLALVPAAGGATVSRALPARPTWSRSGPNPRSMPEKEGGHPPAVRRPPGALVLTSIGHIRDTKLNAESIVAFAELARSGPTALFLFVGAEMDGGETRRTVERLGLARRVRFLGHYPADLADFGAISDIGVCLRRPPTNGGPRRPCSTCSAWACPQSSATSGPSRPIPTRPCGRSPGRATTSAPWSGPWSSWPTDADARASIGRSALQYIRGTRTTGPTSRRGTRRSSSRPTPAPAGAATAARTCGLGPRVGGGRLGSPGASRHTVAGILTTRPFRSDKEERGVSAPRRRWIGTRRPSRPGNRSDRLIRRSSSGRPPPCPVISGVPRREES